MDHSNILIPVITALLALGLAFITGVYATIKIVVSGMCAMASVFFFTLTMSYVYESGNGEPIITPDRLVVGYVYETVWQDGVGGAILRGVNGEKKYYTFKFEPGTTLPFLPPKRFTVLANGKVKSID